MADERTPLIAVVQTRPATHRYPNRKLRRTCTTLLSVVPLIILIVLLLELIIPGWQIYAPWSRAVPKSWPQSNGLSYDDLSNILLSTPNAHKAREWSKYYTSGPHLAGKNLSQAIWTKEKWQEFGVENTLIVDYDTYINYPKGHRLALLENTSKSKRDNLLDSSREVSWEIKYEASLEEDVLEEDSTSGLESRIPTFHGYSASGNVTGRYVYCNYGTYKDFEELQEAGIELEGAIGLIKYGRIFRGLKVKRAQEVGLVGAVIYSDPGDDGEVTEVNGFETYPKGPARHPSSVQRGSTQFLSFAPGDPSTPGYPSKPGVPRQPVDHAIPSIPSIPISYLDALPLLKALNGYGPKASDFNKYWENGGLGYKGVKYNIGPSPENLVLNLVNEQDYVTTPLWNVIGIINGTISDEVVVLGNHRDAWIAGGAGDPNSGSAAFNEVIRGFGKALQTGWKPLRTIVFASWDGEEYGLVGSTEWVEEYVPWLQAATVAYLNVDVGTRGPNFEASAAPLLNKVLLETVNLVQSPNQTVANQTVGDVWNKRIHTMGSGSDFTAFQDFAGIPSLDMGFGGGGPKDAVYHYHSNYDSFHWMDSFGDPGFHYHATIARIWGLLAARLVESPIIQLNATDYAKGLTQYVESVKQRNDEKHGVKEQVQSVRKSFASLDHAIERFRNASFSFDAHAQDLEDDIKNNPIPWWKWWEKIKLYLAVRRINNAYKALERHFLHADGLDGRPWFKHVVFAPGKWTGYSGATFPGIVEGIDENRPESTERWINIIADLVHAAAKSLED